MSFFAYKNGEMHAEGVALATIAAQVGTPFYCYSAGALRAGWQEFASAMRGLGDAGVELPAGRYMSRPRGRQKDWDLFLLDRDGTITRVDRAQSSQV